VCHDSANLRKVAEADRRAVVVNSTFVAESKFVADRTFVVVPTFVADRTFGIGRTPGVSPFRLAAVGRHYCKTAVLVVLFILAVLVRSLVSCTYLWRLKKL
jgi:uncharacterized protein YqhQ